MSCHALAPRSVLLSWVVAVAVWPVAWALPLCAQGLATAAVGGSWIGLSLPWGATPWALVNEPTIAFAASRAALWAYWLPPPLLAALLALGVPVLAPTSGRWAGELAAFHLALASAVLGLGWAPHLAADDGWLAGLVRFSALGDDLVVAACLLIACLAAPLAFRRLGGRLWPARGGATRWRRVLLVVWHGLAPAAAWAVAARLLGWPLSRPALAGMSLVLGTALLAALTVAPRAAVRPDLTVAARTLVVSAVLAALVALPAAWAGAAREGRARALLWGQPSETNNVRPAALRVPLTPLRGATAPPAR